MAKCTPAFVVWKSAFALEIPTVDAEHRRFLEMMNELYDAMTRGDSDGQLRATRANLEAYAAFHFAGEDELLGAVEFPGRAGHRKQHAWFTEQLKALQMDRSDASRATLTFMKDWFVQHILGADREYAAWINTNVSVAPTFQRKYTPPASLRR